MILIPLLDDELGQSFRTFILNNSVLILLEQYIIQSFLILKDAVDVSLKCIYQIYLYKRVQIKDKISF